jgi:alpha-L-arabinofuranosidase
VEVANYMVRRKPESFFGFNMEFFENQTDLFDPATGWFKPNVVKRFSEIPGSMYRYPGGLLSNHFNWEWAVGPYNQRPAQRSVAWHAPAPVMFGVDEYFHFVDAVHGRPWYTLNLLGWSSTDLVTELPSKVVADSNARLATYVLGKTTNKALPRYYQLGNELDRSVYEWLPEKYIQRSQDTIGAMRHVDPDARFVAFLRDFDWKYKVRSGSSTYADFMSQVLTALPMVNDFSLHYYYDYPSRFTHQVSLLPRRLALFKRAIRTATEIRGGKTPNVWVTEHGRSRDPDQKGRQAYKFTGGMGGAISSADFWIAVAQIPAIQGAFLHTGAQWSIFDLDSPELSPMPVYWTIRILSKVDLPIVLATVTTSPNHGGYNGGYDIRAAAFKNETNSNYGLWVVNRSDEASTVTIKISELAGKQLQSRHYFMAGRIGVPAEADTAPPRLQLEGSPVSLKVNANGEFALTLPANSVSSFLLTP